ncbi:hypothetical protein [Carnobacterium divergens]|uniref:hypothetical protein n=1 Tax=Carnobacterium divergens TaxID=2748 RepID=UPI0028905993|nr:hypothetical protein [Carnobacterium divergens]MDT2011224.1 hypothetical protein [Carnobacterium divergens]
MINKIKSKRNEFWLIEELERRNGIVYGNAVKLSKMKGDAYYFTQKLPIIKIRNIENVEKPSTNELLFFDYVRRMKEVPNIKLIVNDFGVDKYFNEN